MQAPSSTSSAQTPSTPTAPPKRGGINAAAIGSIGIALGFFIVATAARRSDLVSAGWVLGISSFIVFMGAISFPKGEPGAAVGLGAVSLLVGIISMTTTQEVPNALVGMLGFAITRLVAKHSSTFGRIAAGIAGLVAIGALSASPRDLKDMLPALAISFAALAMVDSFALFARASTTARATATPAT